MVPAVVPKRLCGAVLLTARWGRYSHSFQEKSNCKTINTGEANLPLRYLSSNQPRRVLDEVGYRLDIVDVEHRQGIAFRFEISGDGDDIGITCR